MGLITGILTLPVAPVRGTVWVADQVLRQAESEYYDPASIRRQLDDIADRRAKGEIAEEDAIALEEELVDRLLEAPSRRTQPEG